MARLLSYLPTELMLQIINEAITLPDGLHSDHWHENQQDLVNKLSLRSHEMSARSRVTIQSKQSRHRTTAKAA
jgi:hypothetical protein